MAFPATELDALEGSWQLVGTVLGKPLEQRVTVASALGGAYLRIHYAPSTVTPLDLPRQSGHQQLHPDGVGHDD